jgi:2',3'-cyclic-nucleotide 2'-phosphodiesterase (5'-nucleotidase family)/PKD repeat protein
MKKYTMLLLFLAVFGISTSGLYAQTSELKLDLIGQYQTGIFDEGAAEISAYDAASKRLFFTNADQNAIVVLDLSDPTNPIEITTIDMTPFGDGVNSVATSNGLVAVAVQADPVTSPGSVEFFNASDASHIATVAAGALPDMLTFTHDGSKVLVANEGEPNDDYTVDPEGSVTIIDISAGASSATTTTATFTAIAADSAALVASGLRIFGPGATFEQDLEPEYISISGDNSTAFVALQENNAIAVVDLSSSTVTDIYPLGFKDHSMVGNELDASNRDGMVNIANWPVKGMYQPDAITTIDIAGTTYILTANEGDARDYDGFSEEFRIKDFRLNSSIFMDTNLQEDENLGRLRTTSTMGMNTDSLFFVMEADSAQEVSGGDNRGSGEGEFKYDVATQTMTFTMTFEGLDFLSFNGSDTLTTNDTSDDVTAMHIHNAASGVNGGVLFNILGDADTQVSTDDAGITTVTGIWTEADASFGTIIAEMQSALFEDEISLYVNTHKIGQPSGAIRGQLIADPMFDELYSYGARSFSIWNASNGSLVWDSGSEFESKLATLLPNDFNSTNSENDSFDNRSDDKGPEPEAISIAKVAGSTYALIALERVGGVMVYNIDDVTAPEFVSYTNDRDFSIAFDEDDNNTPDILAAVVASAPEDVTILKQGVSPIAAPVAVVSNEVTGSITVHELVYQSDAKALFFSEYGEGSSQNKYLEIYNASDATVDLTEYAFPNMNNGLGGSNQNNTAGEFDFWNSFPDGSTIEPGEVFIIADGDADATILAEADLIHEFLSNGDDAYALVFGTEDNYEILDIIGDLFADPGTGWDVAGVSEATKDHVLVRKSDVMSGNAAPLGSFDTSELDSEWIVLENEDWSSLGFRGLPYTLTVLHNNDGESQLINAGAGLENFGGVARFKTLSDQLKQEALDAGNEYLMVSSGDNFLPGPEFNASLDLGTYFDARAIGLIGYDALAMGNHDFDAGPAIYAEFIADTRGNEPTFLSANLDFTLQPDLLALEIEGRVAKSTIIETEGGLNVGIVGATTENLGFISSPGTVIINEVLPSVQAEVDKLESIGVDAIVLISHLQGIEEDSLLAESLSGVDIMIAGGGDELLANEGDLLIPGDEELIRSAYPIVVTDADGKSVPVVTTKGNYTYLGRLNVSFDDQGNVISYNGGPVRVADASFDDGVAEDAQMLTEVVQPVQDYVAGLESQIVAETSILLMGERSKIRSRETNLGNLITDGYRAITLDVAQNFGLNLDEDRLVAVANGGGIRDEIPAGEISAKQTFDVLPFGNILAVVENVSPELLLEIMENAVSRIDPATGEAAGGGTGRFAQISGFSVEFDPTKTAIEYNDDDAQSITTPGERVQSIILDDGTPIVVDGVIVDGAPTVDLVTADFTARGGDQYPFRGASFTTIGLTYQQSLQIYLEDYLDSFVTALDYPLQGEGRIVDLANPIQAGFTLTVLHNNDGESQLINAGTGLEDFGGVARFKTLADELKLEAAIQGNDFIMVSSGDNYLPGPEFNASLDLGTYFDARAIGLIGYDALAMGNHDFDAGPVIYAEFIEDTEGNMPPFLSANLDFSNQAELAALEAEGRVAKSIVAETFTGRRIGIIGATTENLGFISSPGTVIVNEVLPAVQAEVSKLEAEEVDAIVLISHLQGIDEDSLLAQSLTGIDIMIAGGGDELLANDGDLLLPGDENSVFSSYPIVVTDADGKDVPVVTTKGNYTYLGRLNVEFDENGEVVSFNGSPVRVADESLADGVVEDLQMLEEVVEPVQQYVEELNRIRVATSEVHLVGERSQIRSRETNLGNLITDGYREITLDVAAEFGLELDENRLVAVANGGGIRDQIPAGAINARQTFDVLPFGNILAVVENVSPALLLEIMENAVSRIDPETGNSSGSGTGRFAQISGFSVEFDPSKTAIEYNDDEGQTIATVGERVLSITLDDGTVIVENGAVVDGAPTVDLITADFTARGGDQYPFRGASFTTIGLTYQQSLQIYLEDYLGGVVFASQYPVRGEGRIVDVLNSNNVINSAPVIDLPVEMSFLEDETFSFDVNQVLSDANDAISSLSIMIEGNNISGNVSGTTLTMTAPENYFGQERVKVSVTDSFGASASDSVLITVVPVNDAPIAEFSIEQSGFEQGDNVITLSNASNDNNDPNGLIVSYFWEFGDGTTSTEANPVHTYSSADEFEVKLTVTDNEGATTTKAENVAVSLVTSTEADGLPTKFALNQNYPNPFNPSTYINYDVPEASQVSIVVYNMLGQKMATLVNEVKSAGSYSLQFDASALSSGVYIYRLEAGSFVSTKKMTLVK